MEPSSSARSYIPVSSSSSRKRRAKLTPAAHRTRQRTRASWPVSTDTDVLESVDSNKSDNCVTFVGTLSGYHGHIHTVIVSTATLLNVSSASSGSSDPATQVKNSEGAVAAGEVDLNGHTGLMKPRTSRRHVLAKC